ncbi:MAG: glycosyltransferase [Desulfovibrio sp.]
MQYEKHLLDAGVRVLRYDPWSPQSQFEAADIVHYFSVMGASWLFCRHAVEVRRKPLIISPIVWIDKPEKYNLQDIGWLLGMATHILPNSQAECDQLAGLFGIEPTRFSPIVNGVSDIFFSPVAPTIFREQYGIPEPFVLCMGNIEERKNQLRLIEALADTTIPLVLAGQSRESEYATKCRKLAGKTVHFVENLAHGSEMQRSAYAAASILVLPSTLETPGLAALEAAAGGTRLALTQEGCTREYFGTFAEYFDPYNVENMREAILRAMKKPKPPTLSVFIREHYTWKRAAEQLVATYQKILSKRA